MVGACVEMSSDSQLLTTAQAVRNGLFEPSRASNGFEAAQAMKAKMKSLGRWGCDDFKETDARMAKTR